MRSAQALLTILTICSAKTLYDLDEPYYQEKLGRSGLKFRSLGATEILMASSASGATEMTWLVDRISCRDILEITKEFVYKPPDADVQGFDIGEGKEVFTLTATAFGNCTFRIAYAKPKNFISFEDYASKGGLIVEIPIQAINPLSIDDQVSCDWDHENCSLKERFNITRKVERNYLIMGIQAFVRSISATNILVFMPQAVTWAKSKNGNIKAAGRFIWLTKWWTQVFGWMSSAFVVAMGVVMVNPGLVFDDHRRLMASNIRGKTYQINRSGIDFLILMQASGVALVLIEVTCWVMFYLAYGDAIQYGKYLQAQGEFDLLESDNPF